MDWRAPMGWALVNRAGNTVSAIRRRSLAQEGPFQTLQSILRARANGEIGDCILGFASAVLKRGLGSVKADFIPSEAKP